MLIAKVDGTVVLDVSDAQSMFPGVSFGRDGPNADFLVENSCLPVTVWKPYDAATQKLVSVSPYIENAQVFTVQVAAMTTEDLAVVAATEWVRIRIQRDALLVACDWTQLPDSPVDKVVWASYRVQLRDVTTQTLPVVWPVSPDAPVITA
jgi:hypothetical protein